MPVHMRFRDDGLWIAQAKAKGQSFESHYDCQCGEDSCPWQPSDANRALWEATPVAEPGDTWRIRWHARNGDGPTAGYAICCLKCREVHHWTSANNCAKTIDVGEGHKVCAHNGKSSCWTWTGSAEDNTLSAYASLFASGACGYHGWLQNGVLSDG